MSDNPVNPMYRRDFLESLGKLSLGAAAAGGFGISAARALQQAQEEWKTVSSRKVRVGIVGYGVCRFGAAFGFQDHPNVDVVAVSDLIPERRNALMKACRCDKSYESLEEMVEDKRIEAVFVATDAPSHARHCIDVLRHDKHVMTAVPAVFGSIEQADQLVDAVQKSGLKYMMAETSCFRPDCYAMRKVYIWPAHLFRRRVLPLPLQTNRLVQRLAHRPAAAVVSHALNGLLCWRHRQAIHLGILLRLQLGHPVL